VTRVYVTRSLIERFAARDRMGWRFTCTCSAGSTFDHYTREQCTAGMEQPPPRRGAQPSVGVRSFQGPAALAGIDGLAYETCSTHARVDALIGACAFPDRAPRRRDEDGQKFPTVRLRWPAECTGDLPAW
jgi:predicted dithiol-disulfide oxidoreductase (DUF899 family)